MFSENLSFISDVTNGFDNDSATHETFTSIYRICVYPENPLDIYTEEKIDRYHNYL